MQTGGSDLSRDQLIGRRYRVVVPIGQGGMGMVCLARDTELDDERVALKFVAPNTARSHLFSQRLKNEVILARRLTHPNIVRIYDFGGPENGSFYIIMEYVDGISFREVLERRGGGGLPIRQAVSLLFQVAVGLDYAHARKVIHRDLKPDNILLSTSGEVRISDFGSARCTQIDSRVTPDGELVGTPHYLAPEMFRGDRPQPTADVYAFGILAFELLTGRLPFEGKNFLPLLGQHLNHPLPSIRSERPDVPSWLESLVTICAEKDPCDRFQGMAEIAHLLFTRLCEIGHPPPVPGLPSTLQQSLRARPKKKWFSISAQRSRQ